MRTDILGTALAACGLLAAPARAQQDPAPIIDVHLHASPADGNGPPPLEEPLVRHPRLGLYVMHAGWPMIDDLLALMWAHSQVYVDTGIIICALPTAGFYRYLQRIVEAGFGKRVMFGSGQMVWPGAIERGIDIIKRAPFLSAEQTRDILYNNAARFLRLQGAP